MEALAGPADDAARFFAAVHDLTMTVTEAWNAVRARRAGGRVEELVKRAELERCRDAVVDGATALRDRLAPQSARATEIPPLIRAVDAMWSYRSRDNYRTETYTVTVTDSKGKSRTETRTRQVYVNTDHWFEFTQAFAPPAEAALREWTARGEHTTWRGLGVHAHRVRLDKMSPAERSFLERLIQATVLEDPEAQVPDDDVERYANQWLLGTRIDARLAEIEACWRTLHADVEGKFDIIHRSNANYHYVTTSRSHDGPAGYQAASFLRNQLAAGERAWESIDDMLTTCVESAQTILEWARDPEQVESDRQYADVAVAAYQAAFPASEIVVDQLPSHGWTAAITVVSGGLTALLTWALHPAGWNLLG